jgi:hypothetical protein
MTALVAGIFTVNASASSMPGDLLYEIKLGWEEFRLFLAFDDDFYQELKFKFEAERLYEGEALLGEGREEDVEFLGLIESIGEESWMRAFEIGDLVKVEALTQEDGTLLAIEIYGEDFDDIDDDSDDDMDDDSDDDMDDDSDDDMDDSSDDDIDDSSDDDDESDDSSDDSEDEEDEEDEEDKEDEEDEEDEEDGS